MRQSGSGCGTEKASYVAAYAEVIVDQGRKTFTVRRVCPVFECGTILNPANLRSQVHGCMIIGLRAVLVEERRFESGRILNRSFTQYSVLRFQDVPDLDVHPLKRTDIEPAECEETPITAIAPAIANAIFHAIGVPVRELPIKL